jgi:hypothetical protein
VTVSFAIQKLFPSIQSHFLLLVAQILILYLEVAACAYIFQCISYYFYSCFKVSGLMLRFLIHFEFYTTNEQTEKEIKETIQFIIILKKIKYLEINLSKVTKDLCSENYKSLKRETEEGTRR